MAKRIEEAALSLHDEPTMATKTDDSAATQSAGLRFSDGLVSLGDRFGNFWPAAPKW